MSHLGAPIPECVTSPDDNCQPVQITVLCDDNGPFIRRYIVSCPSGDVLGFTDHTLDGSTPYAPVGTVGDCNLAEPPIRSTVLCDGGNSLEPFLRVQVLNDSGAVISTLDFELDGTTPYVVVGPLEICGDSSNIRSRVLCDSGASPTVEFLRTEVLDGAGNVIITIDTESDGVTPYVVIGPIAFECCNDCDSDAFRQRRDEIVGLGAWVRPATAQSVTVKCRAVGNPASPPTITDASATVTSLFVGDEETWTTPDGTPFSSPFTVATSDPGDMVTIVWVEVV
jgi:hypothetical protein